MEKGIITFAKDGKRNYNNYLFIFKIRSSKSKGQNLEKQCKQYVIFIFFKFPLKNKSYLVICKRCISRHRGETPKTWLLCETSYCEATQGKTHI